MKIRTISLWVLTFTCSFVAASPRMGFVCSQQVGPATVRGRVVSRTAFGGKFDIEVHLKKCRCNLCPNPEKCDCCVDQVTFHTDEQGNFEFKVFPGSYSVQAVRGQVKSEKMVVEVTPEGIENLELRPELR